MMSQTTNEAKIAALGFLYNFYLNNPRDNEMVNHYIEQMSKFAKLTPIPTDKGDSIESNDFLSPSFWHACCAVLIKWISKRIRNSPQDGSINVYRGQTNSWPIMPSIRRGTLPNTNTDYLEELTNLLDFFLPDENETSDYLFSSIKSVKRKIALAQHHHFPTDLLDFSFNPVVSLYFASRKADNSIVNNNGLNSHGVIYESTFTSLKSLANRTDLEVDLTLLPPLHVPRIYQQQGFFLDCENASMNQLAEIEKVCKRIYFPREYPIIPDADDVFSETLLIMYLSRNYNEWNSQIFISFENEWYAAHEGYKGVMDLFIEYIHSSKDSFNLNQAVSDINEQLQYALPQSKEVGSRLYQNQ